MTRQEICQNILRVFKMRCRSPLSSQHPGPADLRYRGIFGRPFADHCFWAGRKSPIVGFWVAPATSGPKTIPKDGGRSPPPFGIVFGAAGAAPIPQIIDFRPGPKPYRKKPSVHSRTLPFQFMYHLGLRPLGLRSRGRPSKCVGDGGVGSNPRTKNITATPALAQPLPAQPLPTQPQPQPPP
jgi:hypothetical protein